MKRRRNTRPHESLRIHRQNSRCSQRAGSFLKLIGGMITHMVDSIHVLGKTPIVSMRHEQGAAFAVEAAGRIHGSTPSVAMATSGPGATNLLTGIGSCFFRLESPRSSLPARSIGMNRRVTVPFAQLGFQETDIATMAAPVTKQVFSVNDAEDLPQILDDAFHIATSGRRGAPCSSIFPWMFSATR